VSLIDDALKRAQAADLAARSTDRPWIPTPMPDPSIARRRTLARWAGIVAALAAAAVAGVWLVPRIAPDVSSLAARRPTAPPAISAVGAVPAAAPTPDAVALATPVVVAPPVAMARATEFTPRPTRRPVPAPAAANAGAPAAEAPPAEGPAPAPTVPAPRAQRAGAGRTYPSVAALPGGVRIELGGIVWSETEPRALLNDRILGTGSYVEGWSIQAIEEDRVVLEKDGATITITVR